ncbi:MAG: hypothetical protein JNJ57_20085 [Saprospiraceae bacterium]|nr:hypothetical protein [Saprospiraceae bacterium]
MSTPVFSNDMSKPMSHEDMLRQLEFAALGLESTEDDDLGNQFIIFQLNNTETESTLLETSQVDPKIEGSDAEPDIQLNMEMIAFHIGQNEGIPDDTRATMRLVIGKDENSRDKYFDTAFWTVAAGLQLYNQATGKAAESKDLKADFTKAFGKRPIEIPGGLARMTFEVIKHREPAWWQRVFGFLQSGTGRTLTSVIGFPAITNTAIGLVDELLNKLNEDMTGVLFKSRPLTLALSKQAKNDFSGGNPRIKVGCLSPGFCVIARGRDYGLLNTADAYFYTAYGKLVPSSVSMEDLLAGKYNDPFANCTYAVFKIGMRGTKLNPDFQYS